MRVPRRTVVAWVTCLAGVGLGTALVAVAGLPSPALFGALLAGLAYAVGAPARWERPVVPGPAMTWAQGIVGVAIGSYVDAATLAELGAHGLPIVAVACATVGVSIALGAVLARAGVSRSTGVFAMICGGASGIAAIARGLGADDRTVAVVQYLRVVIVLLGMPLVTAVVFHPTPTGQTEPGGSAATGTVGPGSVATSAQVAAYVVVALVIGVALGAFLRLPAGAVLGPLAVALVLSVSGAFPPVQVPQWPQHAAYIVIGLAVGLRFTRASLRHIAGILPAALLLIVALLVLSAGLGWFLVAWVGVTPLDAYLATTPGGLYAVLATAVDSGADVSFVLTVQVIRLIAVLASAPVLARVLRPRPPQILAG